MLKGIIVKPLRRINDERGSFTELIRTDWKDILGQDQPVQCNLSISYPQTVRAWHRHVRGQTDYFMVLKGAVKICGYDEGTGELDEVVSTGQDPQLVRVPGKYWHGFRVLGDEAASIVYFTTMLYEHENPDEERRPWNDQKIIPKSVNGRKDDPRTGKPWDWNQPPYK